MIFVEMVYCTPMAHFIGKVTQKALIYKDGKILLNRDVGDETYDLPGGRLDVDEVPVEGLKRELLEELGIEVEVKMPVYISQTPWDRDLRPHVFIAYEVTVLSDVALIKADGVEVAEFRWISKEEIPQIKLHTQCIFAIEAFLSHV